MPTFQFLLHTTGISEDLGDPSNPCVGFYTSRRAKAETADEAFKIVMAEFDNDPNLQEIFKRAHQQGLRPQTDIEETYIIGFWRSLLPWRTPSYNYYPEHDEPDDEQP